MPNLKCGINIFKHLIPLTILQFIMNTCSCLSPWSEDGPTDPLTFLQGHGFTRTLLTWTLAKCVSIICSCLGFGNCLSCGSKELAVYGYAHNSKLCRDTFLKNEVRLLNDTTGKARRTGGTGRGLLPADNPAQISLQDPTQWVRDTLHGDTPTLEQNLKETEIRVVLNNGEAVYVNWPPHPFEETLLSNCWVV